MEAREVLVAFKRIKDDWAKRRPAREGRLAATERVRSNCDVGEVAAGLRASFVDHAKVAVEKDASVFRTPQDP